MLPRVGPYEVIRELARGGMGVVYVARDPALEREVALKVVSPAALDAVGLERFRREGRAAARLRHPDIVAVHALGTLPGGLPYLVMDLVEGESLRARLRRDGPLPPAEAVRLVARVARALEHAHGRGVLHRDLKPANVLVDRDGAPHLTDFGLARLLDGAARVTATGEVMGTIAYMAPEQADGDPARVGAAADVYGLGATLYELLTGQTPFHGLAGLVALTAVLERAPEPPRRLRPDLAPELEAIVLRCLEKDPTRRPPGAGALAQALEDLAAAGAVGDARGPRSSGARRKRLALVGALPLALAAAGERAHAWRGARRDAADAAAVASAAEAEAAREEAALEGVGASERARTAALVAVASGRATADVEARLDRAIELARDDAGRATLLGRRAMLRVALGRRDLAGADARAALAAAPDEPSATLALLSLRRRPGAPVDEDLAVLDALLERAGDDPDVLGVRATARLQAGDADGALADAERTLTLDPGATTPLVIRSRLLLTRGETARALEGARCATVLAPYDVNAWRVLADACLTVDDRAGALVALDGALGLEEDAKLLVIRAHLRRRLGDAAGAEADRRRALELDPSLLPEPRPAEGAARVDPAALIDLARHGDAVEALRALEAATAGRDDPELRAWYALLLADHAKVAAAEAQVAAVLARRPSHPVARLAQALLTVLRGDGAGGRRALEALRQAAPELPEVHQFLGMLMLRGGDLPGAQAALDRAIELDDRSARAHAVRAELRCALEDPAGAVVDAQRAVALRPGYLDGWLALAGARRLQGDDAGVVEACTRALALRPDARAFAERAQAHLRRSDAALALADVERALELVPDDLMLGAQRMRALVLLGRRDEAVAVGEEALRRAPPEHPDRDSFRDLLETFRGAR